MAKLRRILGAVKRAIRPAPPSAFARLIRTQADRDALSERSGPVVLCATSIGGHKAVTIVDGLVATALALRGASPHMLLCDEALSSCENCILSAFPDAESFSKTGPQESLCPTCFSAGSAIYGPLPFPLMTYSKLVQEERRDEFADICKSVDLESAFSFVHEGASIGENVRAGVLRFFGAGDLPDSPQVLDISRRYLFAGLITAEAARAAINRIKPEVVVAHHGIYVPQGVICEVARTMGVRVVNWGPSYRNTTVMYSHDDTYHRTLMDEATESWEQMEWGPDQVERISEYLAERRAGKGDWSWMAKVPDLADDRSRLASELGIDLSRPVFGALTNVLYDANLFYQGNAFTGMLHWLFTTIEHFVAHPELQLVVRIHPHEHQSNVVQQQVGPEIDARFPVLPPNVVIVRSEQDHSTYELMALCRAVFIYGTKTGVELAPMGIPVIVAGEAWIRNKGISIDIESVEQYQEILDHLAELRPSSPETIDRALRFAYHFFFRRMIPLRSLDPEGGWPPRLQADSIEELRPGYDCGLDVICDGILSGADFIYEGP